MRGTVTSYYDVRSCDGRRKAVTGRVGTFRSRTERAGRKRKGGGSFCHSAETVVGFAVVTRRCGSVDEYSRAVLVRVSLTIRVAFFFTSFH